MNFSAVGRFLRSATGRLALTYLAIIMLMSIGFSFVFYRTSSQQLDRELQPRSFYNRIFDGFTGPRLDVDQYLQQRIQEGRDALLARLILVNLVTLVVGSVLSYWLARTTLQPIEDAIEAQSQFVSDASHELRTPLTALQATNEVALRKPKLTITEAKDLLRYNVEEAVKLKALSDGLLGLLSSDKQTLQLVPVSLQEVAGEAMNNILQPALAKGLTVHDIVPDITVQGDKQSLVQAVTILLDNAVKYSHSKGNIYLEGSKKAKHVYLSVRDEGVGIKASDLPHIFRRFYRADPSRSKGAQTGYGLGLAIAQKIIERHNGEITVESVADAGTTFTIKLSLLLSR